MKKFVLLYNTPSEVMAQMAEATDEQKAVGMKAWFDWKDRLGDKMIDLGAPMMGADKVSPSSTSGSLQSSHTGYSIIQAKDKEEVLNLLKGHPHLGHNPDAVIEILECIEM